MKEQPSIFGHSLAVHMANAAPLDRAHWIDRWSKKASIAFIAAANAILFGIGGTMVLLVWSLFR